MARTNAQDFLQNFRFHVEMLGTETNYFTLDNADAGGRPNGKAGFQSCTLPEVSAEATEYREGNFKYTRKFSGVATVTDVSLMRGVALNDSALFSWMMDAIGGGEMRRNIVIHQYSRGAVFSGQIGQEEESDPTEGEAGLSRKYNCFECFPIRCKPAGDLDATSSEVAIQELDVALEYFTISTT